MRFEFTVFALSVFALLHLDWAARLDLTAVGEVREQSSSLLAAERSPFANELAALEVELQIGLTIAIDVLQL